MSLRMNLKILILKHLDWLKEHAYLPQGSNLLKLTQDRLTEKKAIADAGCQR